MVAHTQIFKISILECHKAYKGKRKRSNKIKIKNRH